LIESGHSFNQVKQYTFSQFGLFIKEAYKSRQESRYIDYVLCRTANHGGKDSDTNVKKFLGIQKTKQKKKPELAQDIVDSNWNKLAQAFRGFR
jgi:hypothetical protein